MVTAALRLWPGVLAAGAVFLCALLSAPAADATVTCTSASGTVSITTDEPTMISRSATDILVNSAPCATLAGTSQIAVTGVVTGGPVAIDQGGGYFGSIVFDLSGLTISGDSGLVVLGTPGDDTLVAGADGIDLDGDGDSDVVLPLTPLAQIVLAGQGGDDTIATTGGSGTGAAAGGQRFYLAGGPGTDTIDSTDGEIGPGSGGDLLDGGPGDDVMSGDNADAVYLAAAPSGGTIDITAGTALTGDGSDTFSGIPNVYGTQFADVIIGSDLSNVIFGLDGEDVIHAGRAQDTVDGGNGNDQIFAEGGADIVSGGPGNDVISQIFENGFASDLSGGSGNDVYNVAFSLSSGTIHVNEVPDDGADEIVVSCTPPGGVTTAPGGPGAGTIARGPESVSYTDVELTTIPSACTNEPGPPSGGGGGGTTNPPPVTPPPPEQEPVVEPGELFAFMVAATRRGGVVRFDGRASFVVRAGAVADPTAWRWKLLRPLGESTVWDTPVATLGPGLLRLAVRMQLTLSGAAEPAAVAKFSLPSGAKRTLALRLPAAVLSSAALRTAVESRLGGVATRFERAPLPRILSALDRVLKILTVDGTVVVVRLRVSELRAASWLTRLERLGTERLEQALGGSPIVLAQDARLRILQVTGTSRASIALTTER